MKLFVIFYLISILFSCDGYRILGVFPAPVTSHFILARQLMVKLAEKGHDVTMVTSFEVNNPPENFKEIYLDGFVDELGDFQEFLKTLGNNLYTVMTKMIEFGKKLVVVFFEHPKLQELLSTNEKFDLVISEAMLSESHLGFGFRFECPTVVLCSVGSNPMIDKLVGNPAPSSFVSNLLMDHRAKLGFKDRLINFAAGHMMDLYDYFIHIEQQNALLQKYIPNAPHVVELYKNISVILLNSHVSVNEAKPHVPNMIEIGGFHVEDAKLLPKDLQNYMDSSKNGVILFSLGSNIKSASLDPKTLNSLLTVFSKLPYDILWKFEKTDLKNKPSNVRIEKWLPQNDILGHKNIKLFITHGGLLSTTEAVYHGVPLVGIPVLGDQKMNVQMIINTEIGRGLDFENLEENTMLDTILDVLQNSSYRENVLKKSSLMKDQPLKPIDNAIYWIEYAIRHNGAHHLKTDALNLKWYELYQIDVILFILAVIFISFYIPIKLIKCLCNRKEKKIDKKKLN